MKICAIICEFNPFHNGHKYLIEQAKRSSMCDKVLCIMSGNFTQRGDAAILSKFTRAKHAISGGADCVLELPVPFVVAPAEVFAKGAAKIICSISAIDSIAFGCECGDIQKIENAADILSDENKMFKQILNENLLSGESYAKSLSIAFNACGGEVGLLDKPNNILAVEYVKALKSLSFKGRYFAIKRIGAKHGGLQTACGFASSTAIRSNLKNSRAFIPDFAAEDINYAQNLSGNLHNAARLCLLRDDSRDIARVYGASEGLENKLKELAPLSYNDIIKEATSKRYPSSRIERALTANLLKLYNDDCEKYLKGELYYKPLAVKGNEMLSVLGNSEYPVIVRGRDMQKLNSAARQCIESEIFADSVYAYLGGNKEEYFTILKL